eukprot:g3659.t1
MKNGNGNVATTRQKNLFGGEGDNEKSQADLEENNSQFLKTCHGDEEKKKSAKDAYMDTPKAFSSPIRNDRLGGKGDKSQLDLEKNESHFLKKSVIAVSFSMSEQSGQEKKKSEKDAYMDTPTAFSSPIRNDRLGGNDLLGVKGGDNESQEDVEENALHFLQNCRGDEEKKKSEKDAYMDTPTAFSSPIQNDHLGGNDLLGVKGGDNESQEDVEENALQFLQNCHGNEEKNVPIAMGKPAEIRRQLEKLGSMKPIPKDAIVTVVVTKRETNKDVEYTVNAIEWLALWLRDENCRARAEKAHPPLQVKLVPVPEGMVAADAIKLCQLEHSFPCHVMRQIFRSLEVITMRKFYLLRNILNDMELHYWVPARVNLLLAYISNHADFSLIEPEKFLANISAASLVNVTFSSGYKMGLDTKGISNNSFLTNCVQYLLDATMKARVMIEKVAFNFAESDRSQIEILLNERVEWFHELLSMLPHDEDPCVPDYFKLGCRAHVKKKFICVYPNCKREFAKLQALTCHIRRHKGEKPFNCPYKGCEVATVRKYDLKSHELACHKKEKKFKCPYDGCTFASVKRGNLNEHIRRHTGEKPHACTATGCNRRFATWDSLRNHSSVHTGVYKFPCSQCPFGANSPSGLKRHLQTHTGEKNLACSIKGCLFRTNRESVLKKHMKNLPLHGYYGPLKVIPDDHVTPPPKKKAFPCPHPDCSSSYTLKKNLNNHVKKMHSSNGCVEEPPKFACSIKGCLYRTERERNLRRHMANRRVHGYNGPLEVIPDDHVTPQKHWIKYRVKKSNVSTIDDFFKPLNDSHDVSPVTSNNDSHHSKKRKRNDSVPLFPIFVSSKKKSCFSVADKIVQV